MVTASRNGLWAALGAFLIWGVFPIYWKWLTEVPALQVMAHRLTWCFVFVAGHLAVTRGLGWWRPLVAEPRLMLLLTASAILISLNWWLYIWAVHSGHIVETSLGYFINPLVNVLLGVVVLKERLNARQWLAVAIAAGGVGYLTVEATGPLWIALALAISFALYGLIRKVAHVESIPALGMESAVLVVPVVGYLIWAEMQGSGALGHVGLGTNALLIGAGLVTAVPLALFTYGAQRIPYSMLGVLQYTAPSLQLACGVLIYGEPFTRVQAIGFGCIWTALVVYAIDGALRVRAARARIPSEEGSEPVL